MHKNNLRQAGARRREVPTPPEPTSETLTMDATCVASTPEGVDQMVATLTMDATAVASTPTDV